MGTGIQSRWPLIAATAVFWTFTLAMVALNIARSGGFAYDLDDAYIHLAIARNWADFGVWGVTRYGFTSSTSSILWTGLLGLLMKAGIPGREWLPFGLNLLLGTLILGVVYRWWQHAAPEGGTLPVTIGSRTWVLSRPSLLRLAQFLSLLLFIFIVPLPELVQNGMEHLLQVLLTLGVAWFAGRILSRGNSRWGREEAALLVLTPLMTAARYENLFVVVAILLLFSWQRRWGLALAVLAVAVLPVAIYGWLSVRQGWYFLPNSLLLKAGLSLESWQDVVRTLLGRTAVSRMLFAEGHQIVPWVTLAAAALFAKIRLGLQTAKPAADRITETTITLFLWSLLLHGMFNSSPAAVSGGRYTAYLFALALVALGYLALQWVGRWEPAAGLRFRIAALPNLFAFVVLAGLLGFPFFVRGAREANHQLFGSSNIYEQQVQMGRFLDEFYTGVPVAANDIGAINYFADIRCLDLIGLGSLVVAQESSDGTFVTADIDRVASEHGVRIAIVYDEWFLPGSHVAPPDHWVSVGHWTIRDNVVAGSPTVTFYATSPAEAEQLRANLDEFAARLPERVAYTPVEITAQ